MNYFRRSYSHFNEDIIIDSYLKQITCESKFIVDIGAADGIKMSNTYHLFKKGYTGLAIEANNEKYNQLTSNYSSLPNVLCFHQSVHPENIVLTLESANTPEEFLLLNLDIDSYDYFILEAILEKFHPAIIVTEINESIPPPVKFKVLPQKGFDWKGGHFFGYSIACLEDLMDSFEYTLAELHYNNAILVSKRYWMEKSPGVKQAYLSGYWSQSKRKKKFHYNNDLEYLNDLPASKMIIELNSYFSEYEGKYTIK